MGPSRITTRTAALLPALLALAISLPSLRHGFTYDDVWIVEQRDVVHEGALAPLLTAPYWPPTRGTALWRPASLLAFSAEWALGDGGPALFHGVNILLYAAVAGMVALLAANLFAPSVGLLSGLLFAAHPIHVEVVANVVGQAELIAAACYLGVLLMAWRTSGADPPGRASPATLAGIGFLTLLGLGAKEHVVTLPAAVGIVWWVAAVRRKIRLRDVASGQWGVLAAVLVPIAAYLVARGGILRGVADSGGLAPGLDPDSALERLVVMLPVSLQWLRLLMWPVKLSADYNPAQLVPEPRFGVAHGTALGLWLAILGLAWRLRRRLPPLAAGVALFFVTVSVVSNVVAPLEVLLAERLLFLPSVGWAMALGGLAVAASRSRARIPMLAAAGAAAALLAWRFVDRVPVWRDNDVFFTQMQKDAPHSYTVSRLAASAAFAEGDTARGEYFLREATERNPDDAALAESFGMLLLARGQYASAIPLFAQALQRDVERRGALQGLAVALIRSGRPAEALPWLDRMDELHGPEIETEVLRVDALRGAGRFEEALRVAESALEEHPDDWNLHLMAAESARSAGLCDAALLHVRAASSRAPADRREAFAQIRRSIEDGRTACR